MVTEWSQEIIFVRGGTFKFPNADGVYVIARVINGVSSVCYVGKGNIAERMQAHMDYQNEENEDLANEMRNLVNIQVRFTVLEDADERSNAEFTCYKHYLNKNHPLCNERSPAGQWIEVTVPF